LKNPNERRMRKVVLRTIIIVFIIYLIVGSVGYVTFSNHLLMQNLQNVDKANGVVLLAYGFNAQGERIDYPILVVIVIFPLENLW
jgi:amino acid permease